MLPAFMKETKISIVIVPIVALQLDVLRKCMKGGIHAVLWNNLESAGAHIVVSSAENVVRPEYKTYVKELLAMERKYIIIVDEVHLFLQWKSVRPIFVVFKVHIRPSPVDVAIVGLTPTCLEAFVSQGSEKCGLKSGLMRTVRENTQRGNIIYKSNFVDDYNVAAEAHKFVLAETKLPERDNPETGFIVH